MPPVAPPAILIVEDDVPIRRFLADNLAADGYEPLEADCTAQARRLIAGSHPALALLDLGLPDRDGLELLSELREPAAGLAPDLPVLIVSGRAGELDRVRGLERGADDYLVKPFSYPELRARIAALLRRGTRRPGAGPTRVGTLEIDPASREVWVEGELVHLSKKEFGLARMLASEPTRTFTRDELLREVWGFRSPGVTRTLDSHAHRLRRKLSSGRASYVINVWGVGYKLVDGPVGPAVDGSVGG
jgi:DNA-binding response OmpR family regulator